MQVDTQDEKDDDFRSANPTEDEEEEFEQPLDPYKQFRTNILGRVTILFFFQVILSTMVLIEAIKSPENAESWRELNSV